MPRNEPVQPGPTKPGPAALGAEGGPGHRRLRVLITVHQFFPDRYAGTEVLTLTVARELRRRGHEVHIFTGVPADWPVTDDKRFETSVYDGFPVIRFLHQWMPMGGQTNLMELEFSNHLVGSEFRRTLERGRFDVVHVFHLSRLSGAVFDACTAVGVPVVMSSTDYWAICPMNQLRLPDNSACPGPDEHGANCMRHIGTMNAPPGVARILTRTPLPLVRLASWAAKRGLLRAEPASFLHPLAQRAPFLRERMNRVGRILVPTRLMLDLFARNGIESGRMVLSPYGIDLDAVPRLPLRQGRRRLVLGFIGTLYPHKGPQVLVEAIRRLPADVPVEARIYGRTNEFPDFFRELRTMAAGEKRIQFRGHFALHKLGKILEGIDALVVPSLWHENLPLVVLSALAAGRPVIGSDVGGIREAVQDGINSRLFPPGDSAQLSRLVSDLARDRSHLEALARHAMALRSTQEYVDDVEEAYRVVTEPAA